MRPILPLCIALSCTLFASSAGTAVVKFPGNASQAPSPDGRFAVLNTDQDEEPSHILSLQDKKHGRNFRLFPYRRHVDVSWSMDSKFVFVNDYADSDLADCVVVDANGRKHNKMSDILHEEIRDFMRNFKGSHLFVTCAFWRPKDDLVVSVVGYGDGTLKNSERKFLFNAQSGKAVPAH